MAVMKEIKGLEELQSMTDYGHSGIKIAILDGEVDLNHPCFNTIDGKLMSYEMTEGVNPSGDESAKRHGTAVSSLIFGKPGSNVSGIAPGCSSLIIPIYTEDENGRLHSASQVELAKAITKAVELGANIINISGGQFSTTGDADHFLKSAIEDCHKAGVLIVAATGNEGCECLHVPASDTKVLAVGSLDENGRPTPQTNFGTAYQINGILAPGKNRTAALPGGGTTRTNGATSYATPVVSGIAGLLMSLQIKNGLAPDAISIKSILEQTATSCIEEENTDCKRFLRGKLNLSKAIEAIKSNRNIQASGIEFSQPLNNINMNEITNSNLEEEHKISLESSELVPSEISSNTDLEIPEPQSMTDLSGHEMTMPRLIEIEPSANAPLHTAIENSNVLQSDLASVNPSDQDGDPSIESNSLTKLNNLKIEKMQDNNIQNDETLVANQLINEPQLIVPSDEINPSDCGCKGNSTTVKAKPAPLKKIYALGTIGYDFGSEAHRDSFVQSMGGANPNDVGAMLKYFSENPWAAEEIIWTLNIDSTPIYALRPSGGHSSSGYEKIRSFLEDQQNGKIQRISVPGYSSGSHSLLNGQNVSNLYINLRGMYSWTTEALVSATTSGSKSPSKAIADNVGNFLNRIYYQMRNLGVTAEERALNYAATNAFQVSAIFASAVKNKLELHDISASKSPICRPGSDCYDVLLSFFNPKERLSQARKEYRFTVDVSDVVPVTVGEIRTWSVF